MKIGVLIEARSTSRRLPGKVLMDVGHGQRMIDMVYRRCKMASEPESVHVIMPHDDWEVANHCADMKYWWCMASRNHTGNVMQELMNGANAAELDLIVEVTADCPFIDPELIDEVCYRISDAPIPHFCGQLSIKGFEVRAFWKKSLEMALDYMHNWKRNGSTIFYDRPMFERRLLPCLSHSDEAKIDYSVDTETDLEFARWLYRRVAWDAGYKEILAEVTKDPTIFARQLEYTLSQTRAATTAGTAS
jgi:spore coat polysaccharide biosynthesis protein SpsF (cytidylyltransferase family)